MSNNKLDINFIKKLQREVEPDIKPGETAVEYLKRTEAKRVADLIAAESPGTPPAAAPPSPAVQEVVFYEGYKLPRDFFTMVGIILLKSDDPAAQQLLQTFGFDMKDLNGKPIVFKKPTKKPRKNPKK